jgi:nitrite reductase/ring-hydroxylating ferredoxin subunit
VSLCPTRQMAKTKFADQFPILWREACPKAEQKSMGITPHCAHGQLDNLGIVMCWSDVVCCNLGRWAFTVTTGRRMPVLYASDSQCLNQLRIRTFAIDTVHHLIKFPNKCPDVSCLSEMDELAASIYHGQKAV